MSQFPLEGLRSVDFVVPDLAAATDFYTSVWGLTLVDRDSSSAWLRGSGSDPHLLALHRGEVPAIRSMSFRARPDLDLDQLGAAVTAHGGEVVQRLHDLEEPGGGRGLVVRDPRGRTLRLVQSDQRIDPLPYDPDRPERLAHTNINSQAVDADSAFLQQALGFQLTDRSRMMAFVRTNSDHHSVVIADAPVNTLNHVAFQLPTWEGVMRASGRMLDNGHRIGWGPGRHGPGDNVFSYFVGPFGFVVEFTAEVLQVDDDYRVGGPDKWVWPPGRSDQWGICPPKTEECKKAQLAIPFA